MIQLKQIDCDVIDTCNFSCKDCSRLSPHFHSNHYPFRQFSKDFQLLSEVSHIVTVHMCGGEPLMLGDKLIQYVNLLRKLNICDNIVLITNGSLIYKHSNLLSLFDKVAISLYPTQQKQSIIDWVNSHKEYNIEIHEINSFCKMFSSEKLSQQRAEHSFQDCICKTNCHNVYNGFYYKCFGPTKYHTMLDHLGIDNNKHCGCSLQGNYLEERLTHYLEDKSIMSTCYYCLGNFEKHPWSQESQIKVL